MKKLYLIPSLLGCDEEGAFIFPSHLSYLSRYLEEGYVAEVESLRELVLIVNEVMRKKLNPVIIEPTDLEGKGDKRKFMPFLSWYLMRYVRMHNRRAFVIIRRSGYSQAPPYFRYLEPWVDVIMEVEFRKGKIFMKVEDEKGVEAWTI